MTRTVCDTHVHTKYSADSRAGLDAYCERAVKLGLRALCFTDHVDHNPNDCGLAYYNSEAFFGDFLRVKEAYRNRLTLLCGIEFGEPHTYPEALRRFSALPYDFILGSVHFWCRNMFPSQMIEAGVPVEVCYEEYWDTVLAAVRAGGFDSLAHIDFPKRYYKQLIVDEEKLHNICAAMVQNRICMEINTSSLRKGLAQPMPGREILDIYKTCGGKYVTVGSDAHSPGELAEGRAQAQELIGHFGFEEVVFIQRQMSF